MNYFTLVLESELMYVLRIQTFNQVKAPVPTDVYTLTLHPLIYSILVPSTTIEIFIEPSLCNYDFHHSLR